MDRLRPAPFIWCTWPGFVQSLLAGSKNDLAYWIIYKWNPHFQICSTVASLSEETTRRSCCGKEGCSAGCDNTVRHAVVHWHSDDMIQEQERSACAQRYRCFKTGFDLFRSIFTVCLNVDTACYIVLRIMLKKPSDKTMAFLVEESWPFRMITDAQTPHIHSVDPFESFTSLSSFPGEPARGLEGGHHGLSLSCALSARSLSVSLCRCPRPCGCSYWSCKPNLT